MRTRTRPATLWIGGRLSAIEILCLTSVVRQGMAPVLFTYDEVLGVPQGVEVADASDILPRESIFLNVERQSYAPFSDVFRYTLLRDTDFYWIDADVYALKPFDFESDYFLAEFAPTVGIGVLSLPKTSPTLAALLDVCAAPRADLPWLSRFQETLEAEAGADGRVEIAQLPYKALGPLAMSWLLRQHGEYGQVLEQNTHYPLQPRQILRPAKRGRRTVRFADPMSVHLYGSVQHRKLQDAGVTSVDPECFLGWLLRKNRMGFDLFPHENA